MKVESFQIASWEEPETGLVILENDEWVLVKYIPVDYQVDGFKLYRKAFVERRSRPSRAAAIEKVLNLKGVKEELPGGLCLGYDINMFGSTIHLLNWTEKRYGLFEFQDSSETEVFYGKISQVTGNRLKIDMVCADGSVEEEYDHEFEIDEIRAIAFESDYFWSMKLLLEDKIKNNTLQQNL
ncbi:hypothetical protein [Rufibacter hautae]|uniref:Uncharacterized protein n=1 Tax=Rufibacter hautae TaxID=2595005 RepID=A0A5B6TBR6_9BACT|nr:hypothetical protein [Rufibacter hautae]KAA3437919.1 hypothetical protein FOA19_11590 [Rufibacter hautae]